MTIVYRDRSGLEHIPGSDDVVRLRHGVFGILIVDGHLLVSWPRHQPERAELPGGGIEQGETFQDALIREIYEETGLDLPALDIDKSYAQDIFFYAQDDLEYWNYKQEYHILKPENYSELVFSDKRSTPENGYASWEKIENMNDGNMHVFHYEMLQKLNIV